MDSRFQNSVEPTWFKNVKNQALHGIELLTIQPTTSSPEVFEYDLPTNTMAMFGPLSGFLVKCIFESFDTTDNVWKSVPETDSKKVALQPNWFEHLIKDIGVFQNNTRLGCHDVPRSADPFINTYLFAHMHPETKKYLFPEPQNPGNCVGVKKSDWALDDDKSVWRTYASKVFGNNKLTFRYVPAFTFPFYQQPNFCVDGRPPAVIPMPLVGKMSISVYFKDGTDNIFMKPATNTNKYRVRIESMDLIVEEARCKVSFERHFLSGKKMFYYDGMTRLAIAENIAASDLNHRCRFQNVAMPEGLFICALPKTAINGTYKSGLPTNVVFEKHNIKSVEVKFGNMPLAMKYPKYGDIRNHMMEINSFMDHNLNPPFGVLQDPTKVNYEDIYEGGDTTVYPHVYINLCPSGKETRIVPIGDDGHSTAQIHDLDINIAFNTGGAVNGVTYLLYIFYSDVNMVFDMNTRQFNQYYNRLMKH
jgi:hypothetical protein